MQKSCGPYRETAAQTNNKQQLKTFRHFVDIFLHLFESSLDHGLLKAVVRHFPEASRRDLGRGEAVQSFLGDEVARPVDPRFELDAKAYTGTVVLYAVHRGIKLAIPLLVGDADEHVVEFVDWIGDHGADLVENGFVPMLTVALVGPPAANLFEDLVELDLLEHFRESLGLDFGDARAFGEVAESLVAIYTGGCLAGEVSESLLTAEFAPFVSDLAVKFHCCVFVV